jgi:uncharacterized caspase-like protein
MKLAALVAIISFGVLPFGCAQQTGQEAKGPSRQPATSATFLKEAKLALVIGINHYAEGSDLPDLHWARQDAEDLKKVLSDQGYVAEVLIDRDAIKTTIRRKLRDMVGKVKPGEGTILFAFSGHGAQAPDKKDEQGRLVDEGKQYLMTAESAVDTMDETGLYIKEVERILQNSGAARKIMFIDACRDMTPQGSKGPLEEPTLGRIDSTEGIAILNSTAPKTRSFEDDTLHHGIFTYFLLDALGGKAAGPDGLITFNRVAAWVTSHVEDKRPQQKPYVGGEHSGDFPIAGAPRPQEARRALVVGIDTYQGGGHQLRGARKDARDIALALNDAGFTKPVVPVEDPDISTLRQRIDSFAKSLAPADVGLFYFAGGGAMVDGEAVMLAGDARIIQDALRPSIRGVNQGVDVAHSMKVAELLTAITQNHSGPSILIFDMCLSKVGAQNQLNVAGWPMGNTLVLIAASQGQAAAETSEGGLFTRALLPLLRQPGVSANDIATKVLGSVMAQSQNTQIPFLFPYLARAFYFVPGDQQ